MTPLDSYLARVARELRSLPPAKRDDELRELRSHLEQRVEDFVSDGFAPQEAQQRALHQFGPARSLGYKLCDAWEGIPFSLWRLLATLVALSIIWLVSNIVLFASTMVLGFWDKATLLPELRYGLALGFVTMPFVCGWLFSRCLGRRGPLTTLLYFGALASFDVQIHPLPGTEQALSLPAPFLNLFMAFCGAVCSHDLYRRRLRLVFAGVQTHSPLTSPRRAWRSRTLMSFLALLLVAGLYWRVQTVFHPTSPAGILRASLLTNRGINSSNFRNARTRAYHSI